MHKKQTKNKFSKTKILKGGAFAAARTKLSPILLKLGPKWKEQVLQKLTKDTKNLLQTTKTILENIAIHSKQESELLISEVKNQINKEELIIKKIVKGDFDNIL